eukprot:CAMPEP_0195021462 /NCGR_PEP_ID=MMETSP0326_2-20130528/37969_1 /TAXON_ID=2866 ORGANISM="Crypthecodinium cohnii, Strain Seligo" /NCGR_SAMPLE_ID=MMETSP0326_2 /ASSEMBLY_ACC=CAM_ASM_000348 /LENGTH=70 /DNA_ID=CAMNT_0040040675 /DNA_START=396 /DNA_END=605 /DNA_ORIENTATION=+
MEKGWGGAGLECAAGGAGEAAKEAKQNAEAYGASLPSMCGVVLSLGVTLRCQAKGSSKFEGEGSQVAGVG